MLSAESAYESYQVIIELEIRDNYHLPKLHSLLHYVESIRLFGTTDNYNTEMFERLHAEYIKPAFRSTNKRDERPQMLKWYTRQERVEGFESYLKLQSEKKDDIRSTLKTKDGRPFIMAQ